MGSPLGLWWFAPVLSGGGYGSEAVALLLGLHSARSYPPTLAVRATHHGDVVDYAHFVGLPSDQREALEATRRSPVPSAEHAVVVCHSEPGAWFPAMYETPRCPPPGTAVAVGRTMFETDRLDPKHVKRCNKMHEVWVPTRWGADVFAASGVFPEKIKVVPEAVDVHRFDAEVVASLPRFDLEARATQVLGPPGDRGTELGTKFLSVFKWETRKAPEVLLAAYLDEFTADDDVGLFIRSDLYHEKGDLVVARIKAFARDAKNRGAARWARQKNNNKTAGFENAAPPVFVLPRVPEHEMPSLYHAASAFVLPSRGEGWGRPHCEAMSLGVPVIATNWSGPTAFMTEENSFPVSIEKDLVAPPQDSHWATHKWAQPKVTHLQQLMREVFENPEKARAKGKVAARDVRKAFAPEIVARIVMNHVERIGKEWEGLSIKKTEL